MSPSAEQAGVGIRAGLVAALATVAVVVLGAPAGAHAAFVRSQPEPGVELASAPGVVEIEFSEPLIAELSSLVVTDPDERRWEGTPSAEQRLAAPMNTNAHGVYTVEWKTVSPLDGHTLRGAFRFGVGVDPQGSGERTGVELTRADLLLAIPRAVEYAALLAAVGALLIGGLARRSPPLSWVRVRPVPVLAVALAAGALVVAGEALLAADAPSLGAVVRYLSADPGVPRLARLAAEALALLAAAVGFWALAALGLAAALGVLAASGHAAAAYPAWWGVTVDATHLLVAGLWAGGILTLATLTPPGGWRDAQGKDLLERFSPVALIAFVATVATGTLRGAQELVGFADLLQTAYGRVLSIKVVAVFLMVPLSVLAWRRVRARPRAEAVLALVAVTAAGLLAAYPVPPGRAAEDLLVEPSETPALPVAGDLTLGGSAGDVLVGLTVRPATPGTNDVFVYLLPVGGEEDAARLDASLVAGSEARRMDACAATCRRTSIVLEGGEPLEVHLDGVDEQARFDLPTLPAAPAGDVLVDVDERMGRVTSVRYDEVLGPSEPLLRSTAEIVAPDRIHFTIHTLGRETIRVGETKYTRAGPDEPWEVDEAPPASVPRWIWDYPERVAARIVGRADVGGVPTQVVALFIPVSDALPTWYRLYVDDDGLVRRAEMRARGHFMDHDYFDFNARITIVAPDQRPSDGRASGS